MNELEKTRLTECESIIEHGMKTFVEVGTALIEIRDSRLYHTEYSTFEDYCRERWGMSRPKAYQLIDAAGVVNNLSTMVDIVPINERQARPLTKLEPEQQREAWTRAIETAPEGKITAAHVQSAVDEIRYPIQPERFTRPENLHVSDDSYEWYTPSEIIGAARLVMGEIDLDPASSPDAQKIIKAGQYYTKEIDGLKQPWFGRVWLNPPYCMPDIENFVDRVIFDYQTSNIESAIILVNNSTDTAWFHRLILSTKMACFTKGRVKYWGPHATQARQGQAIFYFGNNPDYFTEIFNQFGVVVRLYDNQ